MERDKSRNSDLAFGATIVALVIVATTIAILIPPFVPALDWVQHLRWIF